MYLFIWWSHLISLIKYNTLSLALRQQPFTQIRQRLLQIHDGALADIIPEQCGFDADNLVVGNEAPVDSGPRTTILSQFDLQVFRSLPWRIRQVAVVEVVGHFDYMNQFDNVWVRWFVGDASLFEVARIAVAVDEWRWYGRRCRVTAFQFATAPLVQMMFDLVHQGLHK